MVTDTIANKQSCPGTSRHQTVSDPVCTKAVQCPPGKRLLPTVSCQGLNLRIKVQRTWELPKVWWIARHQTTAGLPWVALLPPYCHLGGRSPASIQGEGPLLFPCCGTVTSFPEPLRSITRIWPTQVTKQKLYSIILENNLTTSLDLKVQVDIPPTPPLLQKKIIGPL